MYEVSALLSNEFVEFSAKIKEVHDEKTILSEKFKILLDEYKKNVKELDAKAASLQTEFEALLAKKTNKEG